MGRSAESKLEQATRLDKMADRIRVRDPENAARLRTLANRQRSGAIRQMKRRPPRRGSNRRVL